MTIPQRALPYDHRGGVSNVRCGAKDLDPVLLWWEEWEPQPCRIDLLAGILPERSGSWRFMAGWGAFLP